MMSGAPFLLTVSEAESLFYEEHLISLVQRELGSSAVSIQPSTVTP